MSVIVPVFDDATRLRRCLRALEDQVCETDADGSAEIVVCDNGSRDGVEAVFASFPFVRVVREPRPGSYRARNAAADIARGAVLAFTDSDCVPSPDWVQRAAKATDAGGRPDVVVGEIELFDEDDDRDSSGWSGVKAYEAATAFRQRDYAVRVGFGPTANLIVPSQTFKAVGGFDADMRSGGDKDFGRRATDRGIQVRYDPSVVVSHPLRSEPAALERKIRRVVGGDHVATRGRLVRHVTDVIRYALLRPVKATYLILSTPRLRTAERWRALAVVARVVGWQCSEKWALLRGRTPKR